MGVLGGKAEPAGGAFLRVELDEHGLLVAHDPGVVTRLEDDDLGGDELELAVPETGFMCVDQRKPGG